MIAPGVILEAVLLMTDTFIVLELGHRMTVSIPLALGTYPVTASGEPLKSSSILSVLARPVHVAVTVVAAAPDAIADVPKATVPLQTVCVRVELAGIAVPFAEDKLFSAVTDELTSVPLVGSVSDVFALNVSPRVKLPLNVIVLFVPLAIPVPPLAGGTAPVTMLDPPAKFRAA